MAALVSVLPQLPALQILILWENKIRVRRVAPLVDVLPRLTGLEMGSGVM